MCAKYVKKPVEIEAFQFSYVNAIPYVEWFEKAKEEGTVYHSKDMGCFCIKTLEGVMTISEGDFVIRGVSGELYPCKPDIFNRTYVMSTDRVFKESCHDLLTTKYTKVLEEKDYDFNAPHRFKVVNASNLDVLASIHFQEGPIKECGVNGCCNEDLIVMVIRRLEGFQNSEFKCRENAMAITKLEEALLWLRKRTMARENRGVEGTHKV